MRLTERQLRKIVRQELIREQALNEIFWSTEAPKQIPQEDELDLIAKRDPTGWHAAKSEVDQYLINKKDELEGYSSEWKTAPVTAARIDWVLGLGYADALEEKLGFPLSEIEGHPGAIMRYQRRRYRDSMYGSSVKLVIPLKQKEGLAPALGANPDYVEYNTEATNAAPPDKNPTSEWKQLASFLFRAVIQGGGSWHEGAKFLPAPMP